MIFKGDGNDTGLLSVESEKDQFKFTHIQRLDDAEEELRMMEAHGSTDGFSKDRTMRYLGTIPAIIWLEHPEWQHDDKALMRWLQSDEGRKWCVHLPDTGRSGKVIVK